MIDEKDQDRHTYFDKCIIIEATFKRDKKWDKKLKS